MLTRVRVCIPPRLARGLDDCHLQAEANTEIRDGVFACEAHSFDLALDTAVPETARDDDTVHVAQALDALFLDVPGLDEVNVDARSRVYTAMSQRLDQGNIRVLEIHILADHRNIDFRGRILFRLDDRTPFAQVGRRQIEPQLLCNDLVEPLLMHHGWNLVEIVGVPG